MDIKGKSIAVVGASNNPEKYGNKVVKAVSRISKHIFPINPDENEILRFKVFSSINEVKERIDIVVFVVPPKITLEVLNGINNKKLFFWFQQGSFDKEVIAYCKLNGIAFESEKCVIVESDKLV